MVSHAHGRRKPISSEKRERDLYLLYGAAVRNIPHLDDLGPDPETCSLPDHYVPRLSQDSTLSALAQLATIRLGAGRAMISLIDEQRQYILAEATPNMSIHPRTPSDTSNPLWLGSVSIPRTWGLCERVLAIDLEAFGLNELPTLVVRDLTQSGEHANRTYVKETELKFYAGAPLLSPTGAIVGSLCILDDTPRPGGLSEQHRHSLWDVAQSVMDYLHTYTIRDQLSRGERFTRGLISFSEGAENLRPFKDAREGDLENPEKDGTLSLAFNTTFDEKSNPMEFKQITTPPAPKTPRSKEFQQRSIKKLQESALPLDAGSMFSRAANVMMASSDLDGVVILDASIAANKSRQRRLRTQVGTGTGTGTGTEDTGDSNHTATSSSDGSGRSRTENVEGSSSRYAQVLGSATEISNSEEAAFGSLLEADLSRMLQDFPNGKIITFGMDGLALSSTEDSGTSSGGSEKTSTDRSPKSRNAGGRAGKSSRAMQAMLTGARSVAFIPFWDYERSRWFAGCLCWTIRPKRLLSASVDLPYFKVFSHSVMRELSRLDALALNQSKTTFVASISHELRSPLHGILGTLEFIKDTPLDSFQVSMVNSLNACGNTLLDTINHVMDYAKIGEASKNVSSRRVKSTHTVRLSSKPIKSRRSRAEAFDFGIATEEVIEAVFSGSTYVPVARSLMDAPSSPSGSDSEQTINRKICYVVLDVAPSEDWTYCFPVGSWRRIVMNIFGNAIKYTHSGHIIVSLRASDWSKATGAPTTITLCVTDSGIGMSSKFLADKAFQPFSQEDSFASGTGLGLSIVRQIIETNGGKIEVNSEPSIGTKITVKLAVSRPETSPEAGLRETPSQRSRFLSYLSRLRGRSICILQKHLEYPANDPAMSKIVEGLARFTNVLANTLEKHLKMNVVRTTEWTGHGSDIVIVPELSFDYLTSIRRSRSNGDKAPVTIFVAMDALEAATLRSDWRVRSKESVVEIMTQPCGPYKAAYILNQCLDRLDHPEENLQHESSGSELTHVSWADSRELKSPGPKSDQAQSPDPPATRLKDYATTLHATSSTNDDHDTPNLAPEALDAPKVLIVDDNAINRNLLAAFMKRRNYSYQEAENGLDALEAYKNIATKFETILMDMSMPIMDGMTSTQAIREYEKANNLPKCRIVALTGLASASARLEALSSGVDHFMTKPMNFRALETLLKRGSERTRKHSESKTALRSAREETAHDAEDARQMKQHDHDALLEAATSEHSTVTEPNPQSSMEKKES
ncbi:hypothetical protein HBH70_071620 [Parastagonospora nodorum]|nr:hypothetical protein HBH53_100850 [Parastagonospora nodorum]KAH3989114.1 hypothetical protein HBH52_027020 [Parastagonospora nodorum]KAH3997405.1 hypothetical protein HBI10_141060 [Parastagonospora nodorum]KAH4020964.1 hypothetical protein HBI13_109360 [Parastagonospora nodorum]KAH4119517.1 hypothetical protein HBH47_121290 [Parastagonospora nodorum]